MAAVLRVKRALDEEPSCALILSCKRRKTESNAENDSVETLFKFAGTVKEQVESIALLNPDKLIKTDVKKASRPVPKVSEKVRAQTKAASQSNRFKLINYFRAIGGEDQSESKEDGNQNAITVLDVETQPSQTQTSKDPKLSGEEIDKTSASSQFVYDLYYIQADAKDIDVDDLLLDGLVSFAPVESDLVFDSYRNNRAGGEDSDSDRVMDDEDDSNDESNWRNDYPDEEEGESDDGEGLAKGFGRITFGDEELSSDGDDERLIYTEELSPSDVHLYGSAYARFKKRALKDVDSCIEINSNSDEDLCGSDTNTDDSEADKFE